MKSICRSLTIASVALLYLVIGVSSFAQTANDPGAFYRDLAAQDRALAADARKRAQAWQDMAQKARARANSASGAMKQILEDQIAQDEKEAAQMAAQADDWEQKARELDQKAQQASTSGGGGLGPNQPLGGSMPGSTTSSGGGTGLDPTNPLGSSAASPSTGTSSSAACGATQSASGGSIAIPQLLGFWTDSDTGEQVEIKEGFGSSGIILLGKHRWEGKFQAQKLTLSRTPTLQEMGDAPDWAKQQVNGKIKWELDLDAKTECDQLVLQGKWYPGGYKWSEEIDPDSSAPPKRTVSDIGRGTPIDKKYKPPPCDFTVDSMPDEPIDLKLESHPGIMVVPKRDYPWIAEALNRSQPFFVEVRLAYDDAAAQGKSLPVKFEVPATGRTKEVMLSGAPHHGPTVYSTDAPILFERPFDIAGPSDLVKSPFDSENLDALKLKNGDLVKASYKDASTTFRFFESWVQQEIASNEDGFTDLTAAYQQRLATSQDAGEGQELQKRLKMIANARTVINDYHPAASDDQLTDLDRCFIGDRYHRLLRYGPPGADDHDEQARKNWASGPSDSKRFGIQFVNYAEADAVASGILERKQYLRDNSVNITLGFALTEYHLVTMLTGANLMVTAVFGIDEDGNPVDLTGRIFAGVGFASGALFSVALSKYLTDLSPSAKARATASAADEVVDEPTVADYKINPETAETVQENIEGKVKGGKFREPDISWARVGALHPRRGSREAGLPEGRRSRRETRACRGRAALPRAFGCQRHTGGRPLGLALPVQRRAGGWVGGGSKRPVGSLLLHAAISRRLAEGIRRPARARSKPRRADPERWHDNHGRER